MEQTFGGGWEGNGRLTSEFLLFCSNWVTFELLVNGISGSGCEEESVSVKLSCDKTRQS